MNKTNTEYGRELYAFLKDTGRCEYGSVITELELHHFLNIEYPEVATHAEFKSMDLMVLSVTDYVRNILLGEGKAFIQAKGDYRILLPSENAKYIERYMSSADKKLKRALKLSKSMPSIDTNADNKTVKIMLKRESIRKNRQRQSELE